MFLDESGAASGLGGSPGAFPSPYDAPIAVASSATHLRPYSDRFLYVVEEPTVFAVESHGVQLYVGEDPGRLYHAGNEGSVAQAQDCLSRIREAAAAVDELARMDNGRTVGTTTSWHITLLT